MKMKVVMSTSLSLKSENVLIFCAIRFECSCEQEFGI